MSEKKVLPGEYLCSAEEFIPGKNTFTDSDGIFSSVYGQPHYEGKTVNVLGKEVQAQSVDIIGGVIELTENCAFVVVAITIPAGVFVPESISLPISRMAGRGGGYIRNIRDGVRTGDIIRARLLRIGDCYELAFSERQHGIIKAFCSRCRGSMFLKDSTLICSLCGNAEKRIVSSSYGNFK